jgi:hypothetical protein
MVQTCEWFLHFCLSPVADALAAAFCLREMLVSQTRKLGVAIDVKAASGAMTTIPAVSTAAGPGAAVTLADPTTSSGSSGSSGDVGSSGGGSNATQTVALVAPGEAATITVTVTDAGSSLTDAEVTLLAGGWDGLSSC